ncbi:MAG TPA: biopolymer transporter ExbD [Pirellulales bacterium]
MRRKRRKQEDVSLNLAAMLDMAFQLLTFFILTFKPAPVEGQIDLRLPPPQPITNPNAVAKAGADTSNVDPVQGVNSLIISVFPTPSGGIANMAIGERQISFFQLGSELKGVLADPGSPFDQVVVQVGSGVNYENLMKVIDVCTHQKLADGKPLNKLSFVELPTDGGGGG